MKFIVKLVLNQVSFIFTVGIQAERERRESSSFLNDCLQKSNHSRLWIENVFRLKGFQYSLHGAAFAYYPFHLHSTGYCVTETLCS